MSYSNDNEPNSLSLAMFASVGFHAVLFVSMAFFPASSETVKKPLRIVNLLPPNQSPVSAPGSQANTSTLEDILQNPLPDLSAGFPPLGNTSEPPPATAEENTSSYVGNGTNLGSRVDTSALKATNPPNQSFTPSPPAPKASNKPPTSNPKPPLPPSSITPAPAPRGRSNATPPKNLPDIPQVAGAFPSPFGPGSSQSSPNPSVATLSPGTGAPGVQNPFDTDNIPESKQRTVPIISETVPFSYPVAACSDALQGTATVSYYRQPSGAYVEGSGTFENRSGYSVLDNAALDAVANAPAVGTGSYQRYSSRFDFIHSDSVCSASGGSTPPASVGQPTQDTGKTPDTDSKTDSAPETQADDKAKPEKQNDKDKKSKQPDKKPSEAQKQSQPPVEESQQESGGDSKAETKPQEPSSQPPAPLQEPAPKAPASEPSPPPTPEVPPQPSSQPVPDSLVPGEPSAPTNNGSASDLIPSEPSQPAPPIQPSSVTPSAPPAKPVGPVVPPAPVQPPVTPTKPVTPPISTPQSDSEGSQNKPL